MCKLTNAYVYTAAAIATGILCNGRTQVANYNDVPHLTKDGFLLQLTIHQMLEITLQYM